jgi:hypothetical protein
MSNTSHATRRSLLAGIPAAAAAIAPCAATALSELPTQPADDPIFALIAEHKACVAAWESELDDNASRKLLDHQDNLFDQLFIVAPTTAAGVAAWLEHLASPEHFEGESIVLVLGEYSNAELREKMVSQFVTVAAVLRAARS